MSIVLKFWLLFLSVPGSFCDWADFTDLSHPYSDETIFFPGQKNFHLTKDGQRWNASTGSEDKYYQAYSFCMGEHGGTHLDAPYHFWRHGWKVDQIPASRLIDIPGVVVDVSRKVFDSHDPPNYEVTVQDIVEFENEVLHGQIPKNGLVILKTGWGSAFWSDKEKYLGEKSNGTLAFPGLSLGAAKWLHYERSLIGIGIDTASVDPGLSKTFEAHRFLAAKQVYNLENVAYLHLLEGPTAGEQRCSSYNFFVMPLQIVGGTGSPTRILAKCNQAGYENAAAGGFGANFRIGAFLLTTALLYAY